MQAAKPTRSMKRSASNALSTWVMPSRRQWTSRMSSMSAGISGFARTTATISDRLDLHVVRSIIQGVIDDLPRFSRTEQAILQQLIDGRELFGLQIVERSGGGVKRGTVYVTLGRVEDKG